MAGVSRLALLEAVGDRLEGLSSGAWTLTVYEGEVEPAPPKLITNGEPDAGGRVAPYAVLYPSPGTPAAAGRDLADSHRDLDWLLQVTVAAGYQRDLLDAVDVVDERLHGWAPVIEGAACDALRPPPGFDPGPVRRDDDVRPPRHYAPLQYRLLVTR